MKKDIVMPKVKDVYIAIVQEINEESRKWDWIVYLINDSRVPLESVMIMSRGRHEDGRKTSTFRHAFEVVAAKSFKKVELIVEEVFDFENEYLLTFFKDGKLYDKIFKARPHSITTKNCVTIPVKSQEGILLS
ncbi:MAG: hypothetical protein WBA16_10065 [Nonlabens sp.]